MSTTPLTLHAYNWVVSKANKGEYTQIRCWALDRDSKPHLVKFTNFAATCYIQLPTNVKTITGATIVWNTERASMFMGSFVRNLSYRNANRPPPVSWSFCNKQLLYNYKDGESTPCIELQYANEADMLDGTYQLRWEQFTGLPNVNSKYYFTLREAKVSLVRKFLTYCKLHYSSWFTVDAVQTPQNDKISTIQHEYDGISESVSEVPRDESEFWTTSPGVLAIDGEMYSSNHKAFPNMYASTDVCYMISCIYMRYGDYNSIKRYAIMIGKCSETTFPDATVISVKSEIEMIMAFADIINETDPEIVTGYNQLGFDFKYIDHRLKRMGYQWPVMGRLIGVPTEKTIKEWSSKAYGARSYHILNMEGRINIDLMLLVRNDYRLLKYTLDFVCRHFLNETKFDVSALDMFKAYKAFTEVGDQSSRDRMRDILDYCIQDSILVIKLMMKLNVWPFLVAMSSIVDTSIEDLYTRGQQIRCFSQIYNVASTEGYLIDDTPLVDYPYAGGYVMEPITGMHKNVMVLDFNSLYPSIIMSNNMCYTTWIHPDDWDKYSEEDCNIIKYDQPEYIKVSKAEKSPSEDLVRIRDSETEIKWWCKESIKSYEERFYKHKKGILPKLVGDLIDERKAVRAKIKHAEDPVIVGILNARQLSLKVSANSIYGFLGVKNHGLLPFIQIAMAVTAKGRELIKDVGRIIVEELGGEVVYGDTDSVFVKMGVEDPKDLAEKGFELDQYFNGAFAGDRIPWSKSLHKYDVLGVYRDGIMKLEFEMACDFLALTKKRYACLIIGADGRYITKPLLDENGVKIGEQEPELYVKGIPLARRDNAKYMLTIYERTIRDIMAFHVFREAISRLIDHINLLLTDQVPMSDLSIVKTLGSKYKSDTAVMNLFGKRLVSIGKLVAPGDRLDYVVLDNGKDKLGERMYLLEELPDVNYPVDKEYYVINVMSKQINQLFVIAYSDDIDRLSGLEYERPGYSRCRPIKFNKPVDMVYWLCVNNVSKEDILNEIDSEI